jgi:phosphatidylinositol alpha-mannosyltransferase
MVLTRAYACATPVVASDIAGYRDIITNATGWAVPPGNSDAITAAIIALLADESRCARLGAQAREVARSRYSWPRIARRLVQIYEELLTARQRDTRATDVPRTVSANPLRAGLGIAPVRLAAKR